VRVLVIFIAFLSLSLSIIAADWAQLYKAGGMGHKVIVSYEPLKKVVKIEYRKGLFGRLRTKEFSVSNTVLVDEVSSEVSRILKNKKIPKESVDGALEEIQNLKYLDGSSCHIVSFGILNTDNRGELLPMIEEISKKLTIDSKAVASHFLFNLQLEEGEPVELRSLTDKDGNIIQFSLYSEKRDLSKFKISKEGNSYHVLNGGKHVFSLKIDPKNKEHVSVLRPTKSRVQNIDRIHLKIEKTKKGLTSSLYSSNRNKKVLTENVIDLRNSSVQFESVSQVDATDRFYQSLAKTEIDKTLSLFKSNDELFKDASTIFVRCMDEQYLLSIEDQSEEGSKEVRDSCLKETSLELSSIILSREKDLELIDSYSFSKLKKNFLDCLESKEAISLSMNMRVIEHPISTSSKDIHACESSLSKGLYKEELIHAVSKNSEVQSFLIDKQSKGDLLKNMAFKYSLCVEKSGARSSHLCSQKVFLEIDQEAVKLLLTKKALNELGSNSIEEFSLSTPVCKKDVGDCVKEDYLAIMKRSFIDTSTEMLKAIYPASNYKLDKTTRNQYRDRVENCVEMFSLGEASALDAYQRLEDKKYECQINAILKVVPEFSVKEVLTIEPFSMISSSDRNRFSELAKRNVRKATRGLTLTSDIQAETNKVYDKLLPEFVDFYIDSRFEDEEVSRRSKEKILDNFSLSLNGVPSKTIKENVSKILDLQSVKRSDFNSSIFVKDSLRNFEVNLFSESHSEDESNSFKSCMSKYSPQWKDISLESFVLKCKNKLYSESFFKLKKEELEKGVSTHFSLTSIEANDALSPVHYLEKCIQSQSLFTESIVEYRKRLDSCYLLTKLDVLGNVSELNILKNKKILSANGASNSLKVSKECFDNFYLHLLRETKHSTNSDKLKDLVLGKGNNILNLTKESHILEGKGSILSSLVHTKSSKSELLLSFVNNISKTEVFNERFVDDYVKSCTSSVEDNLYGGFQEFILQNISASFDLRRNDYGETNKEILQKVFDQELLAELLKLSQKRSREGNSSLQVDPRRFQVTGELGVESLSKLISLIGEYISKGFVFDKDLMKTELVVFRGELKRALKWLNSTDQPVTLEELEKFFTSTKLADLLAYATVSEQVSNRFDEFISSQEREEKNKLRRKFNYKPRSRQSREQKVEWDRMIIKFSKMKREAKNMTSSYDFRRLFRDGSEASKLKLSKIKTDYLLPLVTKGSVSNHAKNEMMKVVADLILKDNAKGGFAEKFVGSAATEYLQNDSDDHWAITKWLFYDDGDFSWSDLKSTKSGGKAIDYYGKNILLPEILKQNVSKFTKEYRLNHFKKLLRDAQDEHDD
jgi:hypothetical protein